ncbi:di/tricarboxylate transporter [Litorivivens lipolytica]|uniref:Di/tricarboxylate transporter n=1 Tax=Litorivivens lipolytica TaxID=1524264 RepID=A0A7W4Z5I7_9GAMM|nr:SLC13 family permease [Litorivivens lipolytica]MBB3045860.1 di/tricarboxylate transporter [Litorivivens lipolytica]
MSFDIAFTLLVLLGVVTTLIHNRLPADAIMLGALLVLLLTGVVSVPEALAGFANPGLITVALLYVVAAALRDTGAIYWLSHRLLGQPSSRGSAQSRLIFPTAALSAFLNNTTVVAMMIPAVQDWAQRFRLSVSHLLMPLSFAAILGGTCTLIGTSTNLVVDGLWQQRGFEGFPIFELAWVGVPLMLVGALFMAIFAPRLLRERESPVAQAENAREYRVEMTVRDNSPLAGKSIQQAGLRNLSHGYLTDIERDGELFTAVGPERILQTGDVLTFVGAPECARELQRINGLVSTHGKAHKLSLYHHQRRLVEVVIGPEFPALNKSVKEGAFRTRYQAAILSISREGRRLEGKVGETVLAVGDTLLLETSEHFVEQYRFQRDFLLVSPLRDSTPPDFARAPLAAGILLAMVLINLIGWLSVMEAAALAVAALLLSGCVSVESARQNVSVNLQVLMVIAAAFGLGTAMEVSGSADWLVQGLFALGINSPWVALVAVYLVTTVFTEVITNNAAAVLMFPVAMGIAENLGVSPVPFVFAIMFAASASFMTPLGYQTNLMVMGPGGYRFSDYLRLGVPLSILAAVVTLILIPLVWPFVG